MKYTHSLANRHFQPSPGHIYLAKLKLCPSDTNLAPQFSPVPHHHHHFTFCLCELAHSKHILWISWQAANYWERVRNYKRHSLLGSLQAIGGRPMKGLENPNPFPSASHPRGKCLSSTKCSQVPCIACPYHRPTTAVQLTMGYSPTNWKTKETSPLRKMTISRICYSGGKLTNTAKTVVLVGFFVL